MNSIKAAIFAGLLILFGAQSNLTAQTTPSPLPQVSGSIAGSIEGSFETNEQGAATYRMQLALPPGTAGFAPQLTLNYSSQGGHGMLGLGWTLGGISAISRCPPSLMEEVQFDPVDYDHSDRFCLDGQRLLHVAGSHPFAGASYRTPGESFTKITSVGQQGTYSYSGPQSFTSVSKTGVTALYGSTPDSRLESAGAEGVLSWLISRVTDRNGNYFTVQYQKDLVNGETVPLRIDYTGNAGAGLLPYNSVRFVYDQMPIVRTKNLGGQRYKVNSRLRKIEMYADSNKAWEYQLNYSSDSVKQGQYLTSVVECDPLGSCLPATTFSWGEETATSNEFVAGQTLPDLGLSQGFANGKRFPLITGDWNGDGRSDIARVYNADIKFYVSNPGGFQFLQQINIPNLPLQLNDSDGDYFPVIVGDWNGDNRTDFMRANFYAQGQTPIYRFYISTGSGFVPYDDLTRSDLGIEGGGCINSQGSFLTGDWNGDGRTDLARVGNGECRSFVTWIWTSTDFRISSLPYVASGWNCMPNNCPYRSGDWNGDGITDFLRVVHDGVFFYMGYQSIHNPFFGFTQYSAFGDFSPQQGYSDTDTYPIVVGDWNNDGLSDFGRFTGTGLRICESIGISSLTPAAGFAPCQFYPILSAAQGFASATTHPIITGDWNGDGATDIARVGPNGLTVVHMIEGVPQVVGTYSMYGVGQGFGTDFLYPSTAGDWNGDGFGDLARVSTAGISTQLHEYSETNVITEIKDGFGAVTRVTYGLLTDSALYSKYNTAVYPRIDLQGALRVVKRIEVTDDASTSSFLSYRYSGFRHNILGKEPVGFTQVTTTNELYGNTKTIFYRQDNQGYDGLPFKTETRLANGILIHKTEDTWSSISVSPIGQHPYISRTVETQYELDGALSRTTQTDYTLDSWGNPTTIALTRSDGSSETTIHTYHNDSTNWVLGQLLTTQVTKIGSTAQGAPSTTRRSSYQYESTNWKLTFEKTEPNTAHELVKQYGYDQFGNVTQLTLSGNGIANRVEYSTYDPRGQFLILSTNPLGHSVTKTYSVLHGNPLSITDSNGISTTFEYDSFGRELLITNPDGTKRRTLYLQATGSSLLNAAFFVRVDESGVAAKIVYYDALSREIRQETVGQNGQRIYVDKVYDDGGRLTHQSEPYFENTAPLWTVSQHDEIDRVTGIFEPGNVVTAIDHNPGGWTNKYNALGQATASRVDHRGNLVESIDANDNHSYYRYDAYNNLIQTTDAAGNITTTQYDVRGNKVQISDPDTGITTFNHNVLGELLSQTNANGQVLTQTFDLLGRLVQRVSAQGVENWIYDTALNGVGKIHRVIGLNGYEEIYSYDTLGRPSSIQKRIGGKLFAITKDYNSNGMLKTLTYPTGFALTHLYNSRGYLVDVRRMDQNVSVWMPLQRNARGDLESQRFGNQLTTNHSYNLNNGLVQTIQTGASSNIQNLSYQFDAIGNLLQRRDQNANLTENFSYDDVNRLTTAQVVGSPAMDINYDSIGNITYRSDVGTYLYLPARPHAVSSITGGPRPNNYVYDATGNRISSSSGTVAYSAFGKPLQIQEGAVALTFQYGPDQARTYQQVNRAGRLIEQKYYVDGSYEQIVQRGTVKHLHYILAESDPVAIVEATEYDFISTPAKFNSRNYAISTKYLHKDHLGSIQAITNESGALVEVLSFNPWGERRDPLTWLPASNVLSGVEIGFTGHEQLDEVGLIHMNGRVYDPSIGRFISPDPFVQSISNAQNLNRYSYVNNNPLSYVDPSGYFLKGFFKKAVKFLKRHLPTIAAIAVMVVAPQFIGTVMSTAFPQLLCSTAFEGIGAGIVKGVSMAASSVLSSGVGALAGGGNFAQGLRAGIRNLPSDMAAAFVANQVGGQFAGASKPIKALVHGVTNGAVGAAKGEKFASAFAASFAGSLGGHNIYLATALGGTASALTGGKFSDGMVRGAIIHLYNDREHQGQQNLEGTRGLAIDATDRFPRGTVGYSVNTAVRIFEWLVGETDSGNIGYHYLEAETQRLFSLPDTNENLMRLAVYETNWWMCQAGSAGDAGRMLSAPGRAFVLRLARGVARTNAPVDRNIGGGSWVKAKIGNY